MYSNRLSAHHQRVINCSSTTCNAILMRARRLLQRGVGTLDARAALRVSHESDV